MSKKQGIAFFVYCVCCVAAFLLPWWLTLFLLVIPIWFFGYYRLTIGFGLILDLVYGYQIAVFPYHTFRYTLAIAIIAAVIFLLKKVIRL